MKSADRVPIKLTRSKRLENVGLIQSPGRPVCHHISSPSLSTVQRSYSRCAKREIRLCSANASDINLVARQQCPGNTRSFVGQGHRDQPGWFAHEQLCCPTLAGVILPCPTDNRRGTDNKQAPNIAIPPFADADKFLLAATTMRARRQTKPRREGTARGKQCCFWCRRHDSTCRDRPDAGDSSQPPARRIIPMPGQDLLFELVDFVGF